VANIPVNVIARKAESRNHRGTIGPPRLVTSGHAEMLPWWSRTAQH
jgi:hypothetical protein